MRIEVWSDVVCPWCFVGKRRLEGALARFEEAHPDAGPVEVVYRSFELDPSAPQHGHEPTTEVLARKYGRDVDEMRDMQQQLIEHAATEGLALRLFDNVHTRTVDAHRLLHLALVAGGPAQQGRVKEALLAAYFLDARDVGDHEVLTDVAVEAGLDPARVTEVLTTDAYAADVAADIDQARAYGATGVPFFVVNQKYGLSGAQPAEVFDSALERAWADARPQLDLVPAAESPESPESPESAGPAGPGVCGPDGCV